MGHLLIFNYLSSEEKCAKGLYSNDQFTPYLINEYCQHSSSNNQEYMTSHMQRVNSNGAIYNNFFHIQESAKKGSIGVLHPLLSSLSLSRLSAYLSSTSLTDDSYTK